MSVPGGGPSIFFATDGSPGSATAEGYACGLAQSWGASLIVMSVWGVGHSVVITLAAMQDVPSAVYEAADIDGAERTGTSGETVDAEAPFIDEDP